MRVFISTLTSSPETVLSSAWGQYGNSPLFVNHRLLKDAQLFVQMAANSMSAWKTHGSQNEHVHTCLSILTWYTLPLYETESSWPPSSCTYFSFCASSSCFKLCCIFGAHGTYEFHSRNMIRPSGLSGKFFHECLVCCFVMGTVHKHKQAIKCLIKRRSSPWSWGPSAYCGSTQGDCLLCFQSVQTGLSNKTPIMSAGVPFLIKVEIKFIITKLSNVSVNLLLLFSIFTVNDVICCPLKNFLVFLDYIQIINHLVEVLSHETD